MFQTYLDKLDDYDGKSFVFFLGRCQGAGLVPKEKCYAADKIDASNVKEVLSMKPEQLTDGITMVISADSYVRDKEFVDNLQESLAHFYCKHVVFPQRQSTIPDTLGVTEKPGLNIVLEINKLLNMEHLLRSPLCDKLMAGRIKLPVFIAMPGPSLAKLAPRLSEISQKCLTICVPKTLNFFLENGVEPDFVILLDTDERMQQFFPRHRKFENTYLVTLSLAAISRIANNFRGVFLMDSFDTDILKNNFRLRESWLSCFTACLGLAEVLRAPQIFLGGADHSRYDDEKLYVYESSQKTDIGPKREYPPDRPPMVRFSNHMLEFFPLANVSGHEVFTSLHYYATSIESKLFAKEIRRSAETTFYNISQEGILDPAIFLLDAWPALEKLPAIDRKRSHFKIDVCQSIPEDIDSSRYAETLTDLISYLDSVRLQLTTTIVEGTYDKQADHPLVVSLAQRMKEGKTLLCPSLGEKIRSLHASYSIQWIRAAQKARAWLKIHAKNRASETLSVICLEEEIDVFTQMVKQDYPNVDVKPAIIWSEAYGPEPEIKIDIIQYHTLYLWLGKHTVVAVSEAAMERFDYLFERAYWNNWAIIHSSPRLDTKLENRRQ